MSNYIRKLSEKYVNRSATGETSDGDDLLDKLVGFVNLMSVTMDPTDQEEVELMALFQRLSAHCNSILTDANREGEAWLATRTALVADIFEFLSDIAPDGTIFTGFVDKPTDFGFWTEENRHQDSPIITINKQSSEFDEDELLEFYDKLQGLMADGEVEASEDDYYNAFIECLKFALHRKGSNFSLAVTILRIALTSHVRLIKETYYHVGIVDLEQTVKNYITWMAVFISSDLDLDTVPPREFVFAQRSIYEKEPYAKPE